METFYLYRILINMHVSDKYWLSLFVL